MLEAYFDDSGKEADQSNRFVCIAGYLSFVSCWEEFNRKWACLLQEHKLPELHMKHWKSIARQNGWTNHHASAVLNDFVDVIRESDVWGFGAGVDVQQWRALSRERRAQFGSAQEFAMQRTFRMIVDVMYEHALTVPLNLVFDQDEEFSKPRLTRYYGIRKFDPVVRSRAAIISFADAKLCYSLQAADLLAYLTRARLLDGIDGRPETPQ